MLRQGLQAQRSWWTRRLRLSTGDGLGTSSVLGAERCLIWQEGHDESGVAAECYPSAEESRMNRSLTGKLTQGRTDRE